MATLTKTVGAQYPLIASFEFDFTDDMVDTSGATTSFGAAAGVFDIMSLPYGSVVVGGDLVVKTASDATTTHTAAIGDSASSTRYLAATSLKSAARTALTITGYETAVEKIRMTIAQTGGAPTTGTARVNVMFIVNGRQNENLKTV